MEYEQKSPQVDKSKKKTETAYGAISGTPEMAGLIKWQLDQMGFIEQYRHFLLGLIHIKEDNEWKAVRIGKRYCNESGANALVSLLYIYLHKSMILSNLSEKEINRMMLDFSVMLVQYLGYYAEQFEIEYGDRALISTTMEHIVFTNLKRAEEMKTFEGHTATYKTVEEYSEKGGGAKKSLFPFGGLFKRKGS